MRYCLYVLFALLLISHVRSNRTSQSLIRTSGTATNVFMLISGRSGNKELCVTAHNGEVDVVGAAVVFEECVGAVAAGDGRELWTLSPAGQLSTALGRRCMGVVSSEGGRVSLVDCDDHGDKTQAQWEVLGNGQLRLGRGGENCLSQEGILAARANVAAFAAATASSTLDSVAHGAQRAVDNSDASYWASKFDDTANPVTFNVDLGAPTTLEHMDVWWEFPAKTFSVFISADGSQFQETYSTDTNVLHRTRIPLGNRPGTQLRIVMKEPHPVYGHHLGHTLYGIRSLVVQSSHVDAIVDKCAVVAQSVDARDKVFLSRVSTFDPAPAKEFRSTLPALEAAKSALSATVVALMEARPHVEACLHGSSLLEVDLRQKLGRGFSGSLVKQIPDPVAEMDAKHGIDTDSLNELMNEARQSILMLRQVLS